MGGKGFRLSDVATAGASAFGTHSLFLFATTVFVVNATPGADMLLTFTNTMRHRVHGGLATALGISVGSLVHTAAVVLGVAALLAASPAAFRLLQWAGAAYLVWIAITLICDGMRERVGVDATDAEVADIGRMPGFDAPPGPIQRGQAALASSRSSSTASTSQATTFSLFTQGLMTNVLNPKVALFFLALLPQFIAPQISDKTPALIFLGVWFAVQGFMFLAAFVSLVSRLRRWQPTPARRRALHWVAAAALLLVALRVLVSRAVS